MILTHLITLNYVNFLGLYSVWMCQCHCCVFYMCMCFIGCNVVLFHWVFHVYVNFMRPDLNCSYNEVICSWYCVLQPVAWLSFVFLILTGGGLVYYYDKEKKRHIEGRLLWWVSWVFCGYGICMLRLSDNHVYVNCMSFWVLFVHCIIVWTFNESRRRNVTFNNFF